MRTYLVLLLSSFILLSAQPASAANKAPRAAEAIRQLRGQAMGLAMNSDADGALNYYSQALSLAKQEFGSSSPYVGEIYFDMGVVALEADKFEHAENLLKESIKLNPNSMVARLKLGELANKRAQYDEAAKQARYVLSRQKDNLVGRYVLAEAYSQNDNSVKAMQEYFYMDALANGYANVAPPVPAPAAPAPVAVAATSVPKPVAPKAATALQPPKKEPVKKADEKKKVEKPKEEKKPDKKVEKPKQPEKVKPVEKPKKEKPVKEKKAPVTAVQRTSDGASSILGGEAKLKTTPVLLTPVKKPPKVEPKAAPEDNGDTPDEPKKEEPKKPAPVKKQEPAKPAAPKKAPRGFVPPPPPVMPSVVPIAPPPPMQMQAPPKPKFDKPKEKPPAAEPKDDKPEPQNEDPDFLLDWGGKKKK